MSATPLYLAELKSVLTDPVVAREYMVKRYLRTIAKERNKNTVYSIINGTFAYRIGEEGRLGGGGFNTVSNCFGRLSSSWREGRNSDDYDGYLRTRAEFSFRQYSRGREPKNGVEVLGMRPHAKGTTYSTQCRLTVKELKAKCALNGIKGSAKMDKVALLTALMKC